MNLRSLLLLSMVFFLSACASVASRTFDNERALVAAKGEPNQIWHNPDGSRTFEYATQPQGRSCWMYTVNSAGQIIEQFDALAPSRLNRIKLGMLSEKVRRLLGQQRSIQHFPNSEEEVWDWNVRNDWSEVREARFNVHFVNDKVVRISRSFEYWENPRWSVGFGINHGWGGWWGSPWYRPYWW